MAGERAKAIRKAGQDATAEAMRAAEESGALRHLYGSRLDLDDDSPAWLANRILKQEGFAPPLIEEAKDIERAEQDVQQVLERLRRRRDWLLQPAARCTPEQAEAFNRGRERALDDYRAALTSLNRMIRDYNLHAPSALHRRGYIVDKQVDEARRSIAPLPAPSAPDAALHRPRRGRFSWWKRDTASS